MRSLTDSNEESVYALVFPEGEDVYQNRISIYAPMGSYGYRIAWATSLNGLCHAEDSGFRRWKFLVSRKRPGIIILGDRFFAFRD